MDNFRQFYSKRRLILEERVRELELVSCTPYQRGSVCLIKQCIIREEHQISMVNMQFCEIDSLTDQALIHKENEDLSDLELDDYDEFSDVDSDFDD